jgi:hypothetical protein
MRTITVMSRITLIRRSVSVSSDKTATEWDGRVRDQIVSEGNHEYGRHARKNVLLKREYIGSGRKIRPIDDYKSAYCWNHQALSVRGSQNDRAYRETSMTHICQKFWSRRYTHVHGVKRGTYELSTAWRAKRAMIHGPRPQTSPGRVA